MPRVSMQPYIEQLRSQQQAARFGGVPGHRLGGSSSFAGGLAGSPAGSHGSPHVPRGDLHQQATQHQLAARQVCTRFQFPGPVGVSISFVAGAQAAQQACSTYVQ